MPSIRRVFYLLNIYYHYSFLVPQYDFVYLVQQLSAFSRSCLIYRNIVILHFDDTFCKIRKLVFFVPALKYGLNRFLIALFPLQYDGNLASLQKQNAIPLFPSSVQILLYIMETTYSNFFEYIFLIVVGFSPL